MTTIDISVLRGRLNAVFDDVQTDAFCLDHFPAVYDKFGHGMRRDEKLTLLLDHCRRAPEELVRLSALLPTPTFTSPRPYHNLPYGDYTSFVGREGERAWLRDCLSPTDRAWQIALTGIGGVGKSALALSIAHEYRERYSVLPVEERFEAIIWISAKEEVLTVQGRELADLPDLILRTLEDVYAVIARTLEREDITRARPEDQARLVERALKHQRTLLIMDNLESVKDERIKPFLRRLPAPTKAIITSREWLDVADIRALTGLTWEESDLLIVQEADERRVRLEPSQRQRIFELTSGLPLPIRLAIGRMAGGESYESTERWLGDATGELPEYCIQGQMTLVRERDPNAWNIVLACALFDRAAGASRKALGCIADLSEVDRDHALTHLQRVFLINKTETDRFWVLPIVQRYVSVQFKDEESVSHLPDRWLEWLTKFAQSNNADFELVSYDSKAVAIEYPNLLQGVFWCRERHLAHSLLGLVDITWNYAYQVGLWTDAREILDAATMAIEILDNKQRLGWVENQSARLDRLQGRVDLALERLAKAEQIARNHGDDYQLIRALLTRSRILSRIGRVDEAEQLAREVIRRGEDIGVRYFKVSACDELSSIDAARGCFDRAEDWLSQAELWANEGDLFWILADIYYRRGVNMFLQGNDAGAERNLLESQRLNVAWGGRRQVAYAQRRLAQVYTRTGDVQKAIQLARQACDYFDRLGMNSSQREMEALLRQLENTG